MRGNLKELIMYSWTWPYIKYKENLDFVYIKTTKLLKFKKHKITKFTIKVLHM